MADMYDAEIAIIEGFDHSVVGMTEDCRLVYSLDKMIEEFCADMECSAEDAFEFISYNTLRSIPYMGEKAPIVVTYSIDDIKGYA